MYFRYKTKDVCAAEIQFRLEGDVVRVAVFGTAVKISKNE